MDRVAAVVPAVGDIDLAGWLDRFDDLFGRVVAPAFYRREPWLGARSYLLGLVSGLERKNGWTIAQLGQRGAISLWTTTQAEPVAG